MRAPEIHSYFFYRFRRWFKAMADDNFHDWKALVVVCWLQGAFLLSLIGFAEIYCERFVIFPNWLVAVAASLLVLFNYHWLMRNEKWHRFAGKFDQHTKRQQLVGGLLVGLTMLAVVALFIISVVLIEPVDQSQ